MVHLSTKNPILSRLSWQDIQEIYAALGITLQAYRVIGERIKIPTAHIDYSDQENIFFMRWHTDIAKIDRQLAALDAEIARRNNLIGVIG